mgnify:CR=1 FL=1
MKKFLLSVAMVASALTLVGCFAPNNQIKVISYNIRLSGHGHARGADGVHYWDNRKHAAVNMINAEKPTVFGLQEALPEQVAFLDEQKLRYPLTLRRWREGDSFIPFGMAGRKKVGDYLTDQKVPIVERNRQFVLVSGEDIVWIVGRRTDERFRVGAKTENILKITKLTI